MAAMQSSVGNPQIYEEADQKNVPRSVLEEEKRQNRFLQGQHCHKANDPSEHLMSRHFPRPPSNWLAWQEEERSIHNKLEHDEAQVGQPPRGENVASYADPLYSVRNSTTRVKR
jgi:hypothetical protein